MTTRIETKEELLENCAFCNILAGKDNQVERIFFKDANYSAMLVNAPRSRGHFIVFPNQHQPELNTMKNQLGAFFVKAQELAEEAIKVLGAPAYEMKVNNNLYKLGSGTGHVGHIHMHIVPWYSDEETTNIDTTEHFYTATLLRMIGNIT